VSNGQRGGQPGNNNAAKAKDWTNALRWVADNYENLEAGITRGMALRKMAETCFVQAMAGDKDARAEIGNRLDGKPMQPVCGDDDAPPIRHAHRVELVDLDDGSVSGSGQTTP
jgi:pullulanase/glycogen debranching enzyme